MISTMIALHCTAYDVPEINRISKFILPNYSWPEVFLFSFFSLSFPLYHWRITTTATIMWIEKNASLVFMLWKSSSDLQTRIRLCLLLGHFFLFKHFFSLCLQVNIHFFPFIPTFLVPCTINSVWERSMCSACTQVHSLIEHRVMLSVRLWDEVVKSFCHSLQKSIAMNFHSQSSCLRFI